MSEKQHIFLHSLFRTGSTYLWSKLSETIEVGYYEPLHHHLLSRNRAEFLRFEKELPESIEVSPAEYYFKSFVPYFEDTCRTLPLVAHDVYERYFDNSDSADTLGRYIEFLLEQQPGKRKLLQFNRSSGRLNYLTGRFDGCLHIYLHRNARSQFYSYYLRAMSGSGVFFAMDLLISSLNPKIFPGLERLVPLPEVSIEPLSQMLEFYSNCSEEISLSQKYLIFYLLWSSALQSAETHADYCIDMDLLSKQGTYRDEIETVFEKRIGLKVDFSDCSIPQHAGEGLPGVHFEEIERLAQSMLSMEQGSEAGQFSAVYPKLTNQLESESDRFWKASMPNLAARSFSSYRNEVVSHGACQKKAAGLFEEIQKLRNRVDSIESALLYKIYRKMANLLK